MLVGALRQLAALAAPPRCGACGEPAVSEGPVCGRCRADLRSARPLVAPGAGAVDLFVAAAEHTGGARRVAHGLKFGRRIGLAELAAESILAAAPAPELRGAVVPVPAAPLRWRWRGFDPAEEIALALAARAGLEYRPCLRRRSGPRQVGRPRARRLGDPPRVRVRGEVPVSALLVDDVQTTGATLAACAAALRRAGCARVVALTFVRAALAGSGERA